MYPFDSLVILTPIVFFVLLIGFAVIGVFGGWKRAAYWGGGNFVFYCIGLLVWHFTASSISSLVTPLIRSLMQKTIDESGFAQIVTSVVGPLFFLIFMIIANIILVICYYAFAKKLLGLKKQKVLKEEVKKTSTSKSKQVKVAVQTKKGVVHTKWFNMVVGGVGMTALMLPVTLSTTHAVALTTTKASTRAKNALTAGLYNGLQGLAGSMDWFSYYNGVDTGKDYDALFSIISLTSTKITYVDSSGQTQTGDAITAVSNTISNGVSNIVNNTKSSEISLESKETIAPLVTAIDNFSKSFDDIMNQCKDDLNSVFNSTGVTSVIKTIINDSVEPIKINDKNFEEQYLAEDSVFNAMVDGYKQGAIVTQDGESTPITTIENVITTSEQAFNDIVDSVYELYSTENLSDTNKALLKEKTAEMISMFITY